MWIRDAMSVLSEDAACVRVVIIDAKGSTPREAGASLVAGRRRFFGTIGGGTLEFQALDRARRMLEDRSTPDVMTETFALGPSLGQCCGGRVDLGFVRLTRADLPDLERAERPDRILLWRRSGARRLEVAEPSDFAGGNDLSAKVRRSVQNGTPVKVRAEDGAVWLEPSPPRRKHLVLFGAGHIGQEIVRILSAADLEIEWVDQRAELFPDDLPGNVTPRVHSAPAQFCSTIPAGAQIMVLTHDHQLDLEICNAALGRGNFGFLGLIGSETKSARFRKRLGELGHQPQAVDRLICPVGLKTGRSKKPLDVAIQICAALTLF